MTYARCIGTAWLLTLLVLAMSSAVGCASVSKFPEKPTQPEISSEDRAAEVVRDFERKRDDAQYNAAAQSLRKGDLKSSQSNLEQVLARNPQHRSSRLLLAEVMVCQGQPQMAAMQLEMARKHHPDDAEIEHTLALVRDTMDQHEAALTHYRRAAELAPDNDVYAASLRTVSRAPLTPMAESGSTQLAAATPPPPKSVDIKSAPVVPVSYQQPAIPTFSGAAVPVTATISNNVPALLPNEHDAAPLPPAQAAESSTGEVNIRFAEVDHLPVGQAMSALQRPNSISTPSPLASAAQIAQCGQQAIEAGNLDAGVSLIRQAMAAEPQNPQIPISAAVALLRRGESLPAVELMSGAAQSFPSSPRVLQTLGLAQYQSGDFQAAQSTLQQALRLDNSHALSYFLLGSALTRLGQREEAARHFAQARALDAKYDLRR
ncbi:MAG: tetratricopeptide repeat protein [Pirellulales bacterium]|nr:tetratricopeptide repeat protein [Pirellulales bacterium]